MTATRDRAAAERDRTKRGLPRLSGEALLVVIALVAVSVLLIDLRRGRSPDPVATFRALNAAIAERDLPEETAALTRRGVLDRLEWLTALGVEPELTDCAIVTEDGNEFGVRCAAVMGGSHLFSELHGRHDLGSVAGTVDDGVAAITSWALPDEWAPAERSFRRWMERVEPALASRMFGPTQDSPFRFTKEAGALHRTYQDGYLMNMAAPPATPADILDRLATALDSADPQAHPEPAGFTIDFEGGEHFLEFQLAIGIDPSFGDCRPDPDPRIVECRVALGDDYLYSQILGRPVETRVIVEILEDSRFRIASWPPTRQLFEAEYDYRVWVQSVHPHAEAAMFGQSAAIWEFTEASGHLHMLYLSDYLSYLGT